MMIREFSSNFRQVQVYGNLSTLRIESVIAEYELSYFSAALKKIVIIIEAMTPQCPPHFCFQPHKITYLRNAALGQQWTGTPKSNIVTAQYIGILLPHAWKKTSIEVSHSKPRLNERTRKQGFGAPPESAL